MRVQFDNVNFSSNSGPNNFGTKLAKALSYRGHTVVDQHENPEVQLSFIQSANLTDVPIVQRLDGIWHNSEQDWKSQNKPIQETYRHAKGVVYQSHFDRKLVESFFGTHENGHVIHNGTNIDFIQATDPLDAPTLSGVEKVWTCASAWRPHKRLKENVRYFLEHAGEKDCLVIAGSNPDVRVANPRVFYAGNLQYDMLVALYRATDYFLHLAYLDHCPNVVVDARAAGATIICSSAGGTKEIAGPDAIVIKEDEYDFKPCKLYQPPEMDFTRKVKNTVDNTIDIVEVAAKYEKVLESVI